MVLNNAENILIGNQQAEKVYLGTVPIWENLPPEYRKIEYLESSGTQYLRTPWSFNTLAPNVKIWVNACINDNYSVFGARDTFNLTASNGKYIFRSYNRDESPDITPDINIGNSIIKWFFDITTLYADGVNVGTTIKSTRLGGLLPILLFARYDNREGYNEADDMGGNCKIAYFKVQEDSTLICEMIPCIRKADNVPGMYDKVTKTFFTNAGTGDFIVPT